MSRKKPGGKGSSKGEWEAEVDPAQVRFMHARIRPFFSDGKRVEATLAALVSGELSMSALPLITVVTKGGELYSLNNRRLWVLKQLKDKGLIQSAVVRLRPAPSTRRLADKFTPARCALTATFMREKMGEEEGEEEEDDEEDA